MVHKDVDMRSPLTECIFNEYLARSRAFPGIGWIAMS
jgi:hypothetical protein